MCRQVLVPKVSAVHRFMLVSSCEDRFELPSFFNTYEEAFDTMLEELAKEMECDVNWLIENADEHGGTDGCTFSFSHCAASFYHRNCNWEIMCVVVETSPEIRLSAVDNWPDESIP